MIVDVLYQAKVSCTKNKSGPDPLHEQVAIPELTVASPCTSLNSNKWTIVSNKCWTITRNKCLTITSNKKTDYYQQSMFDCYYE